MDKELLIKKLQKHTSINPITNCWLWTGSLSKGGKSEGYGRININNTVYYVHRVSAYIYHSMPLEKESTDLQALHICDMKNCWNPDHIYVGTHADNIIDRDGFCLAGMTRCKNGHDLSDPNSYTVYAGNQRKCNQCRKDNYHGRD